jgi:hypothetical protein
MRAPSTSAALLALMLTILAAMIAAIPAPARAESAAQEVAGLTLPFGGPRTAGKVASTACGGTWVVTPAALKGREPVRFTGR